MNLSGRLVKFYEYVGVPGTKDKSTSEKPPYVTWLNKEKMKSVKGKKRKTHFTVRLYTTTDARGIFE